MTEVTYQDFMLQFFRQLRFNNMPPEYRARFDEFNKNNNLTDIQRRWKEDFLDADGKNIEEPDPNGDKYHLSDKEWEKMYLEFQQAFQSMHENRDQLTNTVDYDNKYNDNAIDVLNEYYGFKRLFGKLDISEEAQKEVESLNKLLEKHRDLLEMKFRDWGVADDYDELLKGIKNEKHKSDPEFKKQLRNIALYLNTYTTDQGYAQQDPSILTALGELKFPEIQKGLESKPSAENITEFKKEYGNLLRTYMYNKKFRAAFPSEKTKTAFEKSERQVAYDDQNSDDYLPPKRDDELNFMQHISRFVSDTYADTLEKYFKFKGNRHFFSPEAKQIVGAIHKAKIKPTDGLDAVLSKASEIQNGLKLKSHEAASHCKWLISVLTDIKSTMPEAFKGALSNGRKMRALVEQIILKAVEKGDIKQAKTAMEVLSVIKYGFTTSKVMDALKNEEFTLMSDTKLSWNKTEGMRFITNAMDKSIKFAFMGIGYGATIAGNALWLSGSKFRGKRGKMTNAQEAWEKQNQADKIKATQDRDTKNPIDEKYITDEEKRRDKTKITNDNLQDKKDTLKKHRDTEKKRKEKYDDAEKKFQTAGRALEEVDAVIKKYTVDLPNEISGLTDEINELKDQCKDIETQLTAIPTPYANALEEAKAQQLQQQYKEFQSEISKKQETLQEKQKEKEAGEAPGGPLEEAEAKHDDALNDYTFAEGKFKSAKKSYESIHMRNDRLEDRIFQFEDASENIKNLTEQIKRRNEVVDKWDDKHKDQFKELMAHWDKLETGRGTLTGPMYSWFKLSEKGAQKKFDKKKDKMFADYLADYQYR
jgi:hypothetical protein